MRILILLLLAFTSLHISAQIIWGVKSFHITSAHTSFPDTARAKGHIYRNTLYEAATHYSDSSVLIIVPENLDSKKKTDLIFWFHGWGNNIDSAAIRYALTRQFASSHVNAVLVLAETAKDAPDSYGGKLETNLVFKELVNDVMNKLKVEKAIGKKCRPGNIMLAGHSGAYRVMAYILQNGGLEIKEIILFDALYADTGKYIDWIKKNPRHRFINMFTDHGGTDGETREMIKLLQKEGISYDTTTEEGMHDQELIRHSILIIHSLRMHNDIINDPDNFEFFMKTSPFLKKIKR